MFSYEQIARWLTFSLDPVTVEDWVANREIFGLDKDDDSRETEELETAYQIEKLREMGMEAKTENLSPFMLLNGAETSGLLDQKDYLIVAPMGKMLAGRKIAEVKLTYHGSKPEKIDVLGGDVLLHELDSTRTLKIEVRLGSELKVAGKSKVDWSGAGKRVLIFDSRGRPLPEMDPSEKQREMVKKLRELTVDG